jgi:hypothetical protein
MSRDEVAQLFREYLRRMPTEAEIDEHSKREYEFLRRELTICPERIALENNPNYKELLKERIAILVSGHIRKLSILNNIERLTIRYNVDFFVFAWDNIGIKGMETNLDDHQNAELVIGEIKKIPNVRVFKLESNKDFILNNQENDTTYVNLSSPEIFIKSQLYAIYNSYLLLENYIKENGYFYDMVIKCRMDCDFWEFNPSKKLFNDINMNKLIFVPNSDCGHAHLDTGTSCWACDIMYHNHGFTKVHIFDHSCIVCDVFAYGSIGSMKKYCSLYLEYDKINELYKDVNIKSLETNDINYEKIGNVYQLPLNGDRAQEHLKSLYYLYCSYPERMLQIHLKDYMLVESRQIKITFYR